jgi:stalled ribosome rescue protein Dom34
MKTKNKLGIWMDHSIAHLMEFTSNHFEIETIESKFTEKKKVKALTKGEGHMLIKEKQQLSDYYKKLGETIKNYKRIILFGPTNAKVELFDLLSEDYRFLKIKFEIKETDKMTENQQHAFVQEYFSKA